jgi:glycosyltransferase involved in cell wall biosynthesis
MDRSLQRCSVLHYVGYDDDRGGVVSVIRALSQAGLFDCSLGVNTGYAPRAQAGSLPGPGLLPPVEFPRLEGESLAPGNFWKARRVAREVRSWLRGAPDRVYHGHSRAGLAVALWLHLAGEQRAVASVHCFGRRRGFYRVAARILGSRLFWLTPAMREYYGVAGEGEAQCIPSCVPERPHFQRSRGVAGSTVVLGGIGEIAPRKGWHLVLEALAGLPAELRARTGFRHIGSAGNSVEARDYQQRLWEQSRPLGDRVTWLGEVSSSEAFLKQIDCLVLPSYAEPFSLAMLEAWQAGVPVLRADSGGAVSLVEPGRNGWLFRTGDAAHLGERWRELLETDALGRVRIDEATVEPFTAPVVARQWAGVYARLLR